jgi:hypothetical protein
MLRLLVLRFLRVAVNVLLDPRLTVPKLARLGVRLTFVPVPDRAMVCGLAGSVSVMVSVPERGPVAVGLKVKLTLQL